VPDVSELKVALVQAAPAWHDPAANRALFDRAVQPLVGQADLVVLPEMLSTGFTMHSRQVAETMAGPTAAWLRETAGRLGAAVAGSVVIEDEGRVYNRLLWADADGEVTAYDKRHLFRMAGEHEHYAAGSARVIVELGQWRILLSVCYDLRFPVWLRCQGDYDALLCVANWPAARQSAWNTLLRARAIENLCYVVAVNRVGVDGNAVAYRGGSAVYDPQGEAAVEVFDEPAVTVATLDLGAVRAQRQAFPAWQDADRFEVLP
jgi:predicted amidohydrolase